MFREEKRVKKRKKVAKAKLSFAVDEDADELDMNQDADSEFCSSPHISNSLPALFDVPAPAKRAKFGKNPAVDTSFLPDREREEEERREREELRKEWLRKQEEMKQEEMEITYSYWDGSGHRKSVMVRAQSLHWVVNV